MVIGKIVAVIVSAALSYAAQALLRKDIKQKQSPLDTDSPATTSTRGSMIPILKGRSRLGAVIGWVGNRSIWGEGPRESRVSTYHEEALHFICVGPVYAIYEILVSGKSVWKGEMTQADNPDGAFIDLGWEGRVYIYWGTATQTKCVLEGEYTRNSAWRGICYAVWEFKRLGTSPIWPVIDYEVEVRPENDYLPDTSTLTWLPFNGGGYHPAAMLYELLFSAPPIGAGLDVLKFNIPSLAVTLGDALRRERVPCRILLQNGESWESGIAAVLQDFGILIGWDVTTEKYKFTLQRDSLDTIQTVPESLIEDALIESITQHHVNSSDRAVYTFTDAARNYKESTVVWSAEGSLVDSKYPKDKKITIASVTNWDAAIVVSERRSQEDFAKSGVYSMRTSRETLLMYPGQRFYIENDSQPFILLSSSRVPEEGVTTLTAMRDTYNLSAEVYTITNSGLPTYSVAEEDPAISILETNRFLNKDSQGLHFLRIRASSSISGATILFSLDSGSTYNISDLDTFVSTGGELTEEMSSDFSLIEDGPAVSLLGEGLDTENLEGAENDWRLGLQLCIIDSEIMFLRNITLLTDTTFTLQGLIRSRYGTPKTTHAIGAKVFILRDQNFKLLAGTYMTTGTQIYFKVLPETWNDTIQASEVSPIIVDITGGGYRAIAPLNLNTTNDSRCWAAGGDVELKWSYRNASDTVSGAGFQKAGTEISYSPPEGTFSLKFYTDADPAVYKGEVTKIATASYSLSAIALAALYGSEPASFTARLVNVLNGLESDYTETTFEKV